MQDVEQQQDQQQLQQPGMRSSVLGSSLPAALSSGSHGIVTPWWWGLRTLVKVGWTVLACNALHCICLLRQHNVAANGNVSVCA